MCKIRGLNGNRIRVLLYFLSINTLNPQQFEYPSAIEKGNVDIRKPSTPFSLNSLKKTCRMELKSCSISFITKRSLQVYLGNAKFLELYLARRSCARVSRSCRSSSLPECDHLHAILVVRRSILSSHPQHLSKCYSGSVV